MAIKTSIRNRAANDALRVTDALLAAPGNWSYGQCSRHAMYRTKQIARYYANLHKREVAEGFRCGKCKAGRPPEAFKCPSTEPHFHWGHGDATPGASSSSGASGSGRE